MEPTAGLAQTALVTRRFTTPGHDPLDDVTWVRCDARAGDFFMANVEKPDFWSESSIGVVAKLYFAIVDGRQEDSVRQMIERVASKFTLEGIREGYFDGSLEISDLGELDFVPQDLIHTWRDSLSEDAAAFYAELCYILVNQFAAFNTPVWLNIGVPGRAQTGMACFPLSIEDRMLRRDPSDTLSIVGWWEREAAIFKSGGGSGINLSRLRGSCEPLSTGGTASGPIPYLRASNGDAETLKSGGAHRRAAKFACLDADHPNILDWIEMKVREDEHMRILAKNGVNMDPTTDEGERNIAETTAFQSVNVSVSCTDAFMEAATSPAIVDWPLVARVTGETVDTIEPGDLLRKIAQAAWQVADPGVIFIDHINEWHTTPSLGPVTTVNTCARRGTRMLTSKGWQLIEDLANTDFEVFDGFGFVEGRAWSTGRRELVRLRTSNGRTIDLTPDHRVYTDKGWIEAGDAEGREVPVLLADLPVETKNYLPKIIGDVRTWGRSTMETLGFIQGDGTFNRSTKATTVCYGEEKDGEFVQGTVVSELSRVVGESGYQPGYSEKKITFSRRVVYDWLVDGMGFEPVPLPDRDLPGFVWEAPKMAQASFLRGLFGANGSVINTTRKIVCLVSTNRRMLQGVQLLLQTMGIASKVMVHNKAHDVEWDNGTYESRESYRLEITHADDLLRFRRHVGFPQISQQQKLDTIMDEGQVQSRNGQAARRRTETIVSVEVLDDVDEVFDFSVETTHAGFANGLVIHNCGEITQNDDTACNLCCINAVKFLKTDVFDVVAGERFQPQWCFDVEDFRHTVDVITVAMDINCGLSELAHIDPRIERNTRDLRQLGMGWSNLGSALTIQGLAYDSDEGRDFAASITALLTGRVYRQSTVLAEKMGSFRHYDDNAETMLGVIDKHMRAFASLPGANSGGDVWRAVEEDWGQARIAGGAYGYRNSLATAMMPAGTTSFLLGADTTGVEPPHSLVTYKQLAAAGTMRIVNGSVPDAMRSLGYTEGTIEVACKALEADDLDSFMEFIKPPDRAVFATAVSDVNTIEPLGHVRMVAALQPYVSQSISKSVNLPNSATVDDIMSCYVTAWKMGVKTLSVYRDGSKATQILHSRPKTEKLPFTEEEIAAEMELRRGMSMHSDTKDGSLGPLAQVAEERLEREAMERAAANAAAPAQPARQRLPRTRASITHKIHVRGLHEYEGYVQVGMYPDGRPGEMFIAGFGKEGSFTQNALSAWAREFSISLQHGTPWQTSMVKHAHTSDETGGVVVPDPDSPEPLLITRCDSIVDYIARWFIGTFGDDELCERMGVMTSAIKERKAAELDAVHVPAMSVAHAASNGHVDHGPACSGCGAIMRRTGSCFSCPVCGLNTGCG